MRKTIVWQALMGAVLVATLHGQVASAQGAQGACDSAIHKCGERRSGSSSGIDPTTAAIIQLGTMLEQSRARREEEAYERELEREQRRAAMEAQWERESEARQAALRQQNDAFQRQLSAKRQEYDSAVDRMRARQANRQNNPMFLSRSHDQGIHLGVGGINDYAGGFNTLTDQNGNQVGSYRMSARRSADGHYVEVEFDVSNSSQCEMYFNGFFRKNDVPYKAIDFGTGPKLASGGSTTLKGRVPVWGNGNIADIHRFTPTADFVKCGGEG